MRRIGIVALFLALVAAFSAGVWRVAWLAALDPLAQRGQSDLALASDRLTGELQRFKELSVLMADHPALMPLLRAGGDPGAVNGLLRETADKTGSLDILLVDATGRELASASGTPPRDRGGEPHFQRAMDGALGVRNLLSDRYGRRIFGFAAPVFSRDGPVIGAVIVVADVEEVEAGWRGDRPTVWFSDAAGVVFMSNRSELLLRARSGDLREASLTEAYRAGEVTPFVTYAARMVSGHDLWTVDAGPYVPRTALHLTQDLPVIGMLGEALLDTAPARETATLQALVAAALCLAFGALLFLATERRRTLAEANVRLEARVAQRTRELEQANTDLRREVAERTDAEARLKRAQAELVQAAKLSALGKMSAGISHELNQPLMAIRSFAENAATFLERGKPEAAAQNLSRISDLARRMGRIIKNLRAFARQESEPLADVDLCAVVEAVTEMAEVRARQAGAAILTDVPAGPVLVRGGEVRLQQVLLNLVSNAIDAMADSPERTVHVTVTRASGRVLAEVRDTGPGIAEPERIFDPFYSTKAVGGEDGMGLGLSISYGLVQSFGGAIRGRNHPDGGAVFTVELDAAQAAEAA